MYKYLRKLLCAVLAAMMIVSLVCPAQAASVKAKVSSSSAKFYRYASTKSASLNIKKGTVLTVTAVKNGWARVKCKGITGYMKTSALKRASAKKSTSWKSKVVAMKWYDGGSSVLKKGHYGYIYDIKSGKVIKVKRMGGSSHADLEPATKKDTAKLKSLGYSWDSRPVILHAGGKFVACAINTMPHGSQTLTSNGFNGQFCLHMVGSKTHGSNKVNEDHQDAIKKAYKWAH